MIGFYENLKSESPWQKTASDVFVDAAFSGGSLWLSGFLGGKAGAAVGSVFPVAGPIVGFCVGFGIGMGISYVTDCVKINGYTVKDWVKKEMYS